MIKPSQEVFIRQPIEEEERVLHVGLCLEWNEDAMGVAIHDSDLELEVEQEILIYFHDRNLFLQIPVRITKAIADGQTLLLELEPLGDPISAEGRDNFRISTITSGLKALIDGKDRCPVRDISATGFAIVETNYKRSERRYNRRTRLYR